MLVPQRTVLLSRVLGGTPPATRDESEPMPSSNFGFLGIWRETLFLENKDVAAYLCVCVACVCTPALERRDPELVLIGERVGFGKTNHPGRACNHVQMWDSGPLVLLASVTQTSFFMHVPGDGPLPCQGQSMCVTPAVKRNLRRWKGSANQACLPSGGGELMSRAERSGPLSTFSPADRARRCLQTV